MPELAEMTVGNSFSFVMRLQKKVWNVESSTFDLEDSTDLAAADDIVVNLGVKPSEPEFTANIASGKIQVDTPAVGYITINLLSTDSLSFLKSKTYWAAAQVKHAADESNNVEWPKAQVFKALENNVAPEAP